MIVGGIKLRLNTCLTASAPRDPLWSVTPRWAGAAEARRRAEVSAHRRHRWPLEAANFEANICGLVFTVRPAAQSAMVALKCRIVSGRCRRGCSESLWACVMLDLFWTDVFVWACRNFSDSFRGSLASLTRPRNIFYGT